MDVLLIALLVGIILIILLILYSRRHTDHEDETIESETELEQEFLEGETIIDYNVYHIKPLEFILYALLACSALFLIGMLFYKNIIIALVIASLGLFYPRIHKKKLLEKRKDELNKQFQQALYSLSSSLMSGRSVENSFIEVVEDLRLLYPSSDTFIIKEFELINKRVANMDTIENALLDFSNRAGVDDITNFTDVFMTCNRTGGDLVEVIRRTADMIRDKFEIQQEISVLVAQKRFESNILAVSPIIIVAVLLFSAEDYMRPLYSWAHAGPIVMTISLGILIFSFWLSRKIMDIEV